MAEEEDDVMVWREEESGSAIVAREDKWGLLVFSSELVVVLLVVDCSVFGVAASLLLVEFPELGPTMVRRLLGVGGILAWLVC